MEVHRTQMTSENLSTRVPPVIPEPQDLQPRISVRHRGDRWLGWGVLLLVVVSVGLLWRFQPSGQFFYPTCTLYSATGLKCPGCGGLRAAHALLNGDIGTAWRMNPLLVLYLPLFGWTLVAWSINRSQLSWRLPNPLSRLIVIGALLGIALGFGLARNLPLTQWLGWG